MDLEDIELEAGTSVKVFWVDGDETIGTFILKERGFIVLDCSGSIQACLPAHLAKIEILEHRRNNDC